jgi:signal recognition particle GTPase
LLKGKNKTTTKQKISINQYLDKVATFVNSEYGRLLRNQFRDTKGTSELAMLATPTLEELEQLKKAVAIMTPKERESAEKLTDEQIERIAADAEIDPANLAIFINGYALHCKTVPGS